ncbi:LodA/GoxA family CTQ-dependent oxidase [Nannocystis radixulma]|uniref:LodA/GoxA family CTQ-dependent oxidase n=1 Tax=Nannocystis radixulma TaxID=2995305 RepID=A0ABT5AZ24_9BACT|nr:LodA/GoxA family CTQ-dependent oxidase [Nannocystis radixulma]MDC0667092.1 LodA/GoxA family CTQ-dependent oxidase [Nannocystis radixulma]
MKDKSRDLPSCFDCATDPGGRLEQMFVEIVQKRRIALGQSPAMRPVFRKLHGVVGARFVVKPGLPPDLAVGVFAGSAYDAWVRFSSDTAPTSTDLTSTIGIGIKLFGVPGRKLLGDGDTHDFLLQNHDVFFVDTAKDMCEFTYAGVVAGDYQPYLDAHPRTAQILNDMAKVEGSVLTTNYWSTLPFRLGSSDYVKYFLRPTTLPANVPDDDPDYLATDLRTRLRDGGYTFEFCVQRRTDPPNMPLDAATVPWNSEPIVLATLEIPKQDIDAAGQSSYGENLAFNIWHALAEHEPVGSIAEVRKRVYAASATTRHTANGVADEEPRVKRPFPPAAPAPADSCIVAAVIHPSIGVARVGNSPDKWFYGPEVPDPPASEPGSRRDGQGRLARQAARFRVYGVDATGKIVRELTDAKVKWTVHLANKKSAWYQFQLALDIPEAASAPPTLLRNAAVGDRKQLVIDPGPRSISGVDRPGVAFDTGTFMGARVYLGELRTDDQGRLVVFGGRGHSASFDGSRAVTFGNNDGWHDDTADGPVTAEVELDGRALAVKPAWVIVAPPDYAPMRKSVRTMWDLMRDLAIQNGMLARPARPSFNHDIRPIFERLSGLQWVNAGFAAAFGWKGQFDLTEPTTLRRLAVADPAQREARHVLANQFRVLDRDAWAAQPWPWMYGDAMNIPAAETPRQNAVLTDTQLAMLQQWAAGDFTEDYDTAPPPARLEDYEVTQQGDALDRAALDHCLADAFHPGCEMTWPVRHAQMYMSAFRFKHTTQAVEPSYGASLIGDTLTLPDGPLAGQFPGGITRWMAVPWQTDTASCRSGYLKSYDPYLPTFWPARVPNQVLTRDNYDIVVDPRKPLAERLAAFANRASWTRTFDKASYTDTINNFIGHIESAGIVEPRPGPTDGAPFPAVLEVEDLPPPLLAVPQSKRPTAGATPQETEALEQELLAIEKVHRFPTGLRR